MDGVKQKMENEIATLRQQLVATKNKREKDLTEMNFAVEHEQRENLNLHEEIDQVTLLDPPIIYYSLWKPFYLDF